MRNLIIGSGPAAAGVALALTARAGEQVTVLDLGGRLDAATAESVAAMAGLAPEQWTPEHVAQVTKQPVAQPGQPLPQKRSYGSSYPFDDRGQISGVTADASANSSAVSGAYGGFSNVWGAQVMPFSRATFTSWPIDYDELFPHYAAALGEMPFAAEHDDYDEHFPLIGEATPLPPLAPRTRATLAHYEINRDRVRRLGLVVGRARLALSGEKCILTGLCLTGCPYGYIWSASQTFDRLRRLDLVTYLDSRLAVQLGEDDGSPFVRVQNQRTGGFETHRADRVFVACGGLGTTRLVAGSLGLTDTAFDLAESIQFLVPFLSRTSSGDPRTQPRQFTLNQFNMLVQFDDAALTTSQVHCYPYNPAMLAAMPAALRHPASSWLTGQLLGRLTAGLGYLPSWMSPPVRVRLGRTTSTGLPELHIASTHGQRPTMLSAVLQKLRKAGPLLDLHPITPAVKTAGAAKSYHFGGSFPHVAPGSGLRRHGLAPTDRLGRPAPWQRIHLVDGSVLPSVASTTFTLTVMANGHRIASEALAGETAAR